MPLLSKLLSVKYSEHKRTRENVTLKVLLKETFYKPLKDRVKDCATVLSGLVKRDSTSPFNVTLQVLSKFGRQFCRQSAVPHSKFSLYAPLKKCVGATVFLALLL